MLDLTRNLHSDGAQNAVSAAAPSPKAFGAQSGFTGASGFSRHPAGFRAEVAADLRDDLATRKAALQPVRDAVRAHRPLPTLTRPLDLGELGEFNAEITYDAGRGTRAVFDTDATGDWFHITAITLNGNDVDVLPVLTAALGQETIDELADTIRAELRTAA